MESHMDRLMVSREEAHRLMYFRPTMPVSTISSLRDDTLTVRRCPTNFPPPQHDLCQKIRCQSLMTKRHNPVEVPVTAVSKRNARERKRVRQVNLGFSALRERVPPGTKNKKLSKLETLRAATTYIRQLQQVLGLSPGTVDENFGLVDEGSSRPGGSPASSGHPSDGSLVSSPYAPHQGQDDHLYDIAAWFS